MLLNLIKNIENSEIIIILLFYILSQDLENENKINELDVKDKNYIIIKTLCKYQSILHKFNSNKVRLKNKYLVSLINNFDYFYIFKSTNFPLVYFFSKNNVNTIYFDGVTFNDKNVIKIFIKIIMNKFNQQYINELLDEKGLFYILENSTIEKTNQFSILEVFDFLYNKIYINKNNKINIIGYSLGGIISQSFSLKINNKYPTINLELNNIETWFVGEKKDEFENFIDKIKNFNNIYNENSPFKVINQLFQPFFKTDLIIKNKDVIGKFISHLVLPFPFKTIHYILNNHSIDNTLI